MLSAISPAIPTRRERGPRRSRGRVPPGDQRLHAEAVPGDQQAEADEDERERDGGIEAEPEPLDEQQEPDGHERGPKDAVGRPETFRGHAAGGSVGRSTA